MPLLMQLHWLKVHDCVIYKVAALMYKCVIGSAPEYLRDLVVKDHGHRLRSTTTMKLPVYVPGHPSLITPHLHL